MVSSGGTSRGVAPPLPAAMRGTIFVTRTHAQTSHSGVHSACSRNYDLPPSSPTSLPPSPTHAEAALVSAVGINNRCLVKGSDPFLLLSSVIIKHFKGHVIGPQNFWLR